uniref:U-box domain-containing protein n=2 Tax=Chrysotila carterae TaxID=13221 RepID=A0A7S4BWZ2_CHRCT
MTHVALIWRAARYGRVEELRDLLDSYADDVEVPYIAGQTPLRAACNSNQIETVDLLLSRGASVNISSPTGSTPLMEAAARGRVSLVRLLLLYGADPSCTKQSVPNAGMTALQLAMREGHTDCASLIQAAERQRLGLPNPDLDSAVGRLREMMRPDEALRSARTYEELRGALEAVSAHSLSTSHLCEASKALVANAEAAAADLRRERAADELRRKLPRCVDHIEAWQAINRASAEGVGSDTPDMQKALLRVALLQRRGAKQALQSALATEDVEEISQALNRAQELNVRGLGFAVRKLAELKALRLRQQRFRQNVISATELLLQSVDDEPAAFLLEGVGKALEQAADAGISADDENICLATSLLRDVLELQLTKQPAEAHELETAIELASRLSTVAALDASFVQTARLRLQSMQLEVARVRLSRQRLATLGLVSHVPLPAEFCCPITQEKMEDPVVASDGRSYERAAISQLLASRSSPLSPLTREPLSTYVVTNLNLRIRIREYEVEVSGLMESAAQQTRVALGHPPISFMPTGKKKASAAVKCSADKWRASPCGVGVCGDCGRDDAGSSGDDGTVAAPVAVRRARSAGTKRSKRMAPDGTNTADDSPMQRVDRLSRPTRRKRRTLPTDA